MVARCKELTATDRSDWLVTKCESFRRWTQLQKSTSLTGPSIVAYTQYKPNINSSSKIKYEHVHHKIRPRLRLSPPACKCHQWLRPPPKIHLKHQVLVWIALLIILGHLLIVSQQQIQCIAGAMTTDKLVSDRLSIQFSHYWVRHEFSATHRMSNRLHKSNFQMMMRTWTNWQRD